MLYQKISKELEAYRQFKKNFKFEMKEILTKNTSSLEKSDIKKTDTQSKDKDKVAEEIRKLSEASVSAGDQIHLILNDITGSTNKASNAVKETNSFVITQNDLLRQTTNVFETINGCIDEMVLQLNYIASSLNNMASNKQVVSDSISNIAAVSAEIAASAANLRESIQSQLDTVEQFAINANDLQEKTTVLQDNVNHFVL